MFGLRKRARLLEQNEKTDEQVTKHLNPIKTNPELIRNFDNLPIEIYYLIFDLLSIKELIKIRQLNHFFKNLIDNTKYIWKKISLKTEINSNTDLNQILDFLESKPHVHNLILACPHTLSKKQINYKNTRTNLCLNLSVNLKQLNIFSTSLLNNFSECRCLKIDSFVNSYGQVKSSKYLSYTNIELSKFLNLESLYLTCKLYDLKNDKMYIWTNVLSENSLLNRAKYLYPNLKNIFIRHYTDSAYKLFKILSKLKNLGFIELENFMPNFEILEEDKFLNSKHKNKLKLQRISFNFCSLSACYFYLKYLSDLNCLNELSLFIKWEILFGDREVNILKEIYNLIASLPGLKILKTNLYQSDCLLYLNESINKTRELISNLNQFYLIDSYLNTDKIISSQESNNFSLNCLNYYQFCFNDFCYLFDRVFQLDSMTRLVLQLKCDCSSFYNSILKYVLGYLANKAKYLIYLELRVKCSMHTGLDLNLCELDKSCFKYVSNGYFCFVYDLSKNLNALKIKF